MDNSRIRNRKSRFFPKIEKKSKSRFYNKIVRRFLSDVEYIYIIMILWRHFGKPEIVAVINNPILHASLGDRRTRTIALSHPPRTSPMWSTITVVHDTGEAEGWRRETVTWYQPPRDTKTAGAVLGVGH